MTKVKSRFPILLAAHREKISDVSRATGISRTTLTNLYYSKGEALSYNVLVFYPANFQTIVDKSSQRDCCVMGFELLDGLTVRFDGLNMNLLRFVCQDNKILPRQCFFQYFFY